MEQVMSSRLMNGLRNENVSWRTSAEAVPIIGDLLRRFHESGAVPVWAVVYGNTRLMKQLRPILANAGAWKRWPLMVLHAEGECGGMQMITLSDGESACLHDRGCVVGMTWKDSSGGARAALCGLTPVGRDPVKASLETMERAADLLDSAGLAWPDVYRTWYFNERILDWYGDFNETRRDYYARQGMSLDRPPASTGIGICNEHNAPLALGLLAARPGIEPGPVPSPLQNEPAKYGSYFSRASEETSDGMRTLWISGTASINLAGETLYVGDFEAQVLESYRVVAALLCSRSMAWNDVRRATVYIREPEDLPHFHRLVDAGVVPDLKAVVIVATVCRESLLFEIELEASS